MSRKVAPVNLKYCIVPKDLIVMHILPNIECGEIPNFIRAFQGHIPRSLYGGRIPGFVGGVCSGGAGGTLVEHEFWLTNQGHCQGPYKTYYANRLSSVVKRRNIVNYHNNKPHGPCVEYYCDTGTVQETGEWRFGKRVGTWTTYHKNGSPFEVMEYDDGYIISRVYFNEDGSTLWYCN